MANENLAGPLRIDRLRASITLLGFGVGAVILPASLTNSPWQRDAGAASGQSADQFRLRFEYDFQGIGKGLKFVLADVGLETVGIDAERHRMTAE